MMTELREKCNPDCIYYRVNGVVDYGDNDYNDQGDVSAWSNCNAVDTTACVAKVKVEFTDGFLPSLINAANNATEKLSSQVIEKDCLCPDAKEIR